MARIEALPWWPAAAEVLVLTCAVALTCGEHRAGVESPAIDLRQVGVPADAATDRDASDGDASDGDASDGEPSDDVATDEEATDSDAYDDDDLAAHEETFDERASRALHQAESYEAEEKYLECAQEAAPIAWRRSRIEDSDLADAIEDVFNRCDEALNKPYEAIKVTDCPLEIEDAIASTAAPPKLVPRAAKAACLALLPYSSKSPRPDDGEIGCPRVALVWSAGGLHRRELLFDGGPLGDEGFCCNLSSIAAGILDGKTLVRVDGSGNACGGGKAIDHTQALYEWNGKSLTSPIDISINLFWFGWLGG